MRFLLTSSRGTKHPCYKQEYLVFRPSARLTHVWMFRVHEVTDLLALSHPSVRDRARAIMLRLELLQTTTRLIRDYTHTRLDRPIASPYEFP